MKGGHDGYVFSEMHGRSVDRRSIPSLRECSKFVHETVRDPGEILGRFPNSIDSAVGVNLLWISALLRSDPDSGSAYRVLGLHPAYERCVAGAE